MPSYPGSIFSPSARTNGQVIDASHINDLQDEVTAIEQGIRNGTAPLNSSNSTLTNLQVTGVSSLTGRVQFDGNVNISGASSFGGTVQVSGNSTFGAALQISGASTFASRPTMPPPDAVKVFLASIKDIGTSNASTLAFVAQDYITNSSLHSTGTNPERLIPQSTGVYRISACLRFEGGASATNTLQLIIQDSSAANIAQHNAFASSAAGFTYHVAGYKRFDAIGGHVVCMLNAGALSTHSLSSGLANSWFAMEKL